MRPVVPFTILALAAVGLSGGPVRAQAGTGAYAVVDTWAESATTLPPAVWDDPSGIDLTPSGRLFVADRQLRRVEELDAAGRPVRDFGRGASPDDLVAPAHLAVDEARDRVYVADPGGRRVAVYALGGARVALWTGLGTPAGVAVAPDGRIAVTDTAGDLVHVLAPDGTEVARWGGTGTGPTQLDVPGGVHVDADGTAWVADRGNGRIVGAGLDGRAVAIVRVTSPRLAGAEVLDVTVVEDVLWLATDLGLASFDLGQPTTRLTAVLEGASAAAVTAGLAHGLYAAVVPAEGMPGVWRYQVHQASGEPRDRWGGDVLVPGYFDGLEAIAVGDDGQAYLLDVPPRVQRLSSTGVVHGHLLAPDPVEVDADASGTVLAATTDSVVALGADGSERWRTGIRSSGGAGVEVDVAGVAWDAAVGRVVVLEAGGSDVVFLDPTGARTGDWSPRARDATSERWADMTVAADGTIYLLDAAGGQVRGFDRYGRMVLELEVGPGAIRFDLAPDGSVVVLGVDGWLRHLERDGGLRAEWDGSRLDRGGASRPVDVAVDAGGRVLVADGAADVVTVFAWDPTAPRRARPQVSAGCRIDVDKHALPGEIDLGDAVEVSLVVRGACAGSRQTADIALLIDTSLDRSLLRAAGTAAETFIDLMDPAFDRVVVQPDAENRLSNDVQYLRRVIRRIEAGDTYSLGGAIQAAEGELFGRRGRPGARKVIVILLGSSRDEDTHYWEYYMIQRAAGQARRRGAEIHAIAFGRATDVQLLYDVTGSRDRVYRSAGTWQLADVYRRVAGEIKPTVLLDELTITDEIPTDVEYVEGSAVPPADLVGRALVWRLAPVPLGGIGVRYRLRPLVPGRVATNVRADAVWRDPQGADGRADFPIPFVVVRAPSPTATPTPTETPTPPPTATVSPTRPALATPTASPTAVPSAIFLPVLLRERCDPARRKADVVLAIDASTSMGEPTSAGRTKIAAATEAARAFLDALDLRSDRAAVVTFSGAAATLQELTGDRAALEAALGRITLDRTTRLDLGVARAREELAHPRRRPDGQAAMVVLTDGRANPVGPEAAVAEAARAKAEGVLIFTVGLGDDLDDAALEAIASDPSSYLRAPDAEDLVGVYETIAARIPCPPAAFWGLRR